MGTDHTDPPMQRERAEAGVPVVLLVLKFSQHTGGGRRACGILRHGHYRWGRLVNGIADHRPIWCVDTIHVTSVYSGPPVSSVRTPQVFLQEKVEMQHAVFRSNEARISAKTGGSLDEL